MTQPDRSNPWTTLASRPVYENPWIAVREDQVIRPDGLPGIYGVVHFKNRAVGVLPVDDRDGSGWSGSTAIRSAQYSWEIPEGGGPPGETPEGPPGASSARRPACPRDEPRAAGDVAPVELGQRRGRLHLPGHRAFGRVQRSRGHRAAPRPPRRLAGRLGDAPPGRDHRLA